MTPALAQDRIEQCERICREHGLPLTVQRRFMLQVILARKDHPTADDVYEQIFDRPDNHAGEMETSIALAYCPELVARKQDGALAADEGRPAQTRFEAVNRGWVSITRPWHLLTTNAGVGNPHAASAEKGRRLIALLADRLAGFLVELSDAELDERFPY